MNQNPLDISSFGGPIPLSNPPPQIFGNYAQDGTLLTPTLTSPVFTDDSNMFGYDDGVDGGDPSDPKRRRIAKVGSPQLAR